MIAMILWVIDCSYIRGNSNCTTDSLRSWRGKYLYYVIIVYPDKRYFYFLPRYSLTHRKSIPESWRKIKSLFCCNRVFHPLRERAHAHTNIFCSGRVSTSLSKPSSLIRPWFVPYEWVYSSDESISEFLIRISNGCCSIFSSKKSLFRGKLRWHRFIILKISRFCFKYYMRIVLIIKLF